MVGVIRDHDGIIVGRNSEKILMALISYREHKESRYQSHWVHDDGIDEGQN